MYGILNSSRYKGKKYKVAPSGKKLDYPLDENRTLIYSPSGRYFRIQDKRVLDILTEKYSKELGSQMG